MDVADPHYCLSVLPRRAAIAATDLSCDRRRSVTIFKRIHLEKKKSSFSLNRFVRARHRIRSNIRSYDFSSHINVIIFIKIVQTRCKRERFEINSI